MKVPLSWLADYVDLPESIDDLVHRLTMSGTEVEEVQRIGQDWSDVTIGLVTSLSRPEGSKTLQVATLDIGERTLRAVTAAPNIAVGQRVPLVPVGGTVPVGPQGSPAVLEPRTMMGITGEAMVLSARELGISGDHAGILVLPEDVTPGASLAGVMAETVLDISVGANRADEMSILGVAREVAAMTRVPLREPDLSEPGSLQHESSPGIGIEVVDPDLCPRYCALRIEGVSVGASPPWLARRLESAGVRSVNNIVDVTNYVMLELGQPLHAFDSAAVPEGRILVRRSRPGETIVTLDGVERPLMAGTLVIADRDGPTGIAGVMGGGQSEISPSTTCIILESANFDRVSIRSTARNLGIRTEASARFERGLAPELTAIAIARCVNLLSRLMDGGLSVGELVDVKTSLPERLPIVLPASEVRRLLGIDVPRHDVTQSLARLGFEIEQDGDAVRATPPYWRRDVDGAADLAEEVARSIGYDRIPETLPGQSTQPARPTPDMRLEALVRETLLGAGVSECWTDTLTSADALGRLAPGRTPESDGDWQYLVANPAGVAAHGAACSPVRLLNPPTEDRSVLRVSLVPALLDVMSRNLKRTREDLAFFEIARTFFNRQDDLPYERRTLALVIAGERGARAWNRVHAQYDFYDLKGMVAAVLRRLGVGANSAAGWSVTLSGEGQHPGLHPGRSGNLVVAKGELGYLGELHPVVARRFEIEPAVRVLVAELDLDSLLPALPSGVTYRPISRYPAVRRDIALVFPESVAAGRIEETVIRSAGPLLRSVRFVDVYQGERLGPAGKSIALSLEFQSDTETLTQEQIGAVQDGIVSALEAELGGELRA